MSLLPPASDPVWLNPKRIVLFCFAWTFSVVVAALAVAAGIWGLLWLFVL